MRTAILQTLGVRSSEPEEEVPEEVLNKEITSLVKDMGSGNEEKEEQKTQSVLALAQKKKLVSAGDFLLFECCLSRG
jgi:hypothetical protein